jgi:hypothetical protein
MERGLRRGLGGWALPRRAVVRRPTLTLTLTLTLSLSLTLNPDPDPNPKPFHRRAVVQRLPLTPTLTLTLTLPLTRWAAVRRLPRAYPLRGPEAEG